MLVKINGHITALIGNAMTRFTIGLAASVVCAAAILLNTAQAVEGNADAENCETSYYGCPCPTGLPEIQRKFHIASPNGMSLVKASCTTKSGAIYNSDFTFAGEMTLKGTVRYAAGETGYNSVTFDGMQFFEGGGIDLNLPPLSDKDDALCWAAPAVLRIRELENVSGGGDRDGRWIKSYDVLKLGKYTKC